MLCDRDCRLGLLRGRGATWRRWLLHAVLVMASSGVNDGVIVRVACHVGRRFEVSRMAVSRDVCFRHHFPRASCGWWFDVDCTFCVESDAVALTSWCCAN